MAFDAIFCPRVMVIVSVRLRINVSFRNRARVRIGLVEICELTNSRNSQEL